MSGNVKEWSQVKVTVALERLDTLTAIMSMIDLNLMIEDFSDIDMKTCYGDLIDESLLNADKTIASVSVFIPAEKSVSDAVAFIKDRAKDEKLEIKIDINGVNEEDWATSWKAYYKPVHIGEKMVIVPMWESYDEKEGEVIVRMDPGMAFGTGTHETTRLVVSLLEKYTKEGCRVLDVGTGSGILAICAAKLGAGECKAYDIDPVAVRVARENIKDNDCDNITCDVSDLLYGVDLSGGEYDLVCANIVADIIIRMCPDIAKYMKDDAILLASGIITEGAAEVIEAVNANGLSIREKHTDNGWCALVIEKNI